MAQTRRKAAPATARRPRKAPPARAAPRRAAGSDDHDRDPAATTTGGDPIRFFATPADLRRWLEKNHGRLTEQWVGFHKRGSGRPSITWPESVDEALCFGWIDGLRKSIDEARYKIRFTPRKPGSIWSNVNTRRVAELTAAGRMHPAGLAAFARRDEKRAALYSFERTTAPVLAPAMQARFEQSGEAWRWWQSRPPWYRRAALHWVVSAKKDETRERRFQQLLECCAAGIDVAPLRRPEPRRDAARRG